MAKHVDYYVSLNSPWTYLGSKRFEAIAKKHGADVTIWPVDFGSVFAVSGGLPLPKRVAAAPGLSHDGAEALARSSRREDHARAQVLPGQRGAGGASCVIALREQGRMADAIKLAHAVLAALWAEEKNTGDPATLQAIIAGCGLDAGAVMKAGEAPEHGREARGLHQAGDRAGRVRRALFVIDGESFWGQDRLDFVDRKLAA